jgi:hypothetical protein
VNVEFVSDLFHAPKKKLDRVGAISRFARNKLSSFKRNIQLSLIDDTGKMIEEGGVIQ